MKIALISMPWAPDSSPSIALGTLKSVLKQNRHHCNCFYLSENFYKIAANILNINVDLMMHLITTKPDLLIYEWLFSRKAFGPHPRDSQYITTYLSDLKNEFLEIRKQFEKTIDEIALKNWSQYDYVGFSCTFNQTVSSIAMAKAIRSHHNVPILFGGCAIDAITAEELAKKIPFIDHIFIGEAEKSLISFLNNPSQPKIIPKQPLTAEEFSTLPIPDYDEFYEISDTKVCSIEASRGCWYGDKILCSFCGMVPEERYRPNKNVLQHIKELNKRYKIKHVEFADLLIPTSFINSLFPQTQKLKIGFNYNIRVDTIKQPHLDKLRIMRDGGTKNIFIGIESLHPKILQLMKKGHYAIDGISILKWAKYYDIIPNWFILVGTPFAKEEWNFEVFNLIKKMTHLYWPGIQPVCVTRNSPYCKQFELDVAPVYYNVYPDWLDQKKLAWEFEPQDYQYLVNHITQNPSIHKTIQFVDYWRQIQSQCSLIKSETTIYDDRDPMEHKKYTITSKQAELLDFCFIPKLNQQVKSQFSPNDILTVMDMNLLITLEGRYLSLTEPEKDFEYYKEHFLNEEPKKLNILYP